MNPSPWLACRSRRRSSTCSFFFSSRRRHTISKRDWSSDVCSSDLLRAALEAGVKVSGCTVHFADNLYDRSEERRVGKECRSRWGADTLKKKETEGVGLTCASDSPKATLRPIHAHILTDTSRTGPPC